jgi:hypothetical protein
MGRPGALYGAPIMAKMSPRGRRRSQKIISALTGSRHYGQGHCAKIALS